MSWSEPPEVPEFPNAPWVLVPTLAVRGIEPQPMPMYLEIVIFASFGHLDVNMSPVIFEPV